MHQTDDGAALSLVLTDGIVDSTDRHIRAAWMAAWRRLRATPAQDGLASMLPSVCKRPPGSPLTAIIVPRARAVLPGLVRSTRHCDAASALSYALPLIGAGPGLTPSWDDLLVGYLCGLRASSGNDHSRCRFVRQFGIAVGEASVATTAVSRAYICRAIQGMPPPWIETTLTAIRSGNRARASFAMARAVRVGHTSGTDTMLGLVLGTCVWQTGKEADEVLFALACPVAKQSKASRKTKPRPRRDVYPERL